MTHLNDQNPEGTKQMSNAYRAAVIVFGAALVVMAFYLLLAWQLGAWQMYALTGAIALFVVDNFLAMRLIQSGQTERGGWMIVIGMMVVFPAAALLVASVGLIFGIVLPVLCIAVSTQILSRVQARRANAASIMVGVLTALLEFLPLEYRLFVPQIQAFVPSIATVIIVVVVFFAIRQNWHNIRNFTRSSIRNRLTAIVVGAALIPVVVISIFLGFVTYVQVRDELTQGAFEKLAAVQTIKHNQVSSYLAERSSDMIALSDTMGSLLNASLQKMDAINVLKHDQIAQLIRTWDADVRDVASDPGVISGMKDLANGFQTLGSAQVRALYLGKGELNLAGDGSGYSAAHFGQHDFFNGYTSIHGYEDGFLIDLDGNVVYSVHKTDAFGTNLLTGAYKDSSLAKLYKNLLTTQAGKSYIADVASFEGTYAMFIGAPVYDGSTLVGMLAYRLPLEAIQTITAEKTGQGLTGDTFLIAMEEDGRITYRSDRTSLGNEEFVIGYDITGIASKSMFNALEGKSGGGLIVGSTGEARINAYRPMEIEGLNWAVFTSVAAAEALSPTHIEGEKDFLTAYQENYGYYDLFLIHPNGFIFYSVTKESDYQTNILTGEYSDSNLAAMVSEIGESKAYEIVDFAHYAPSGGDPAAFFGIPVLNGAGDIQMIVAAQVSLVDLTQILTETTGLGESGETYLVGQDLLFRNNSRHLADLGVETTVLNPAFKVDTVAARAALAGESGQDVLIGYRGDRNVLNVWSPLYITESEGSQQEQNHWALIAAIDEEEALAPVSQLARGLGLTIGLVTMTIGALAVFLGTRFAMTFVQPILYLTDTATQVAAGNLGLRVATDSVDEIGTLTTTFNDMTAQLQDTLEGLEQRVSDRTKALATSAEVTRRLAAILDPRQLTSEVVEQIQRAFNYYYAQIYLLDESGANLVIAGGTGEAGASMMARQHSVPKGRGLVGRAADANASVLVADVSQEEGWLPNELLPETKSEVAIPISIGNQVMGVLDVQHSLVNGLTLDDVTLLESLAGQVAISLQNARSYERSRKQAELESLVNMIGQRIQRTTSIEETLQTAIRELGTAIGASRVKASIRQASRDGSQEQLVSADPSIAGPTNGNGLSIPDGYSAD